MKRVIVALIIVFISLWGCKDKIVDPGDTGLPELSDEIPYSTLGSGKIAFQRIGPFSSSYSGVYIIDINNRKSWSIDLGSIGGPQISPEGDYIVFTKYFNEVSLWDAYLTDIYGNNEIKISSVEAQEKFPGWFPGGKRIIYYSFWGGSAAAFIYDITSKFTNPVIDFGIHAGLYFPEDPVSVSKNHVCLTQFPQGLYIFNKDGSNLTKIVTTPEGYRYFCPSWNPQGDKFAVMSVRHDSTSLHEGITIFYQEMSIILFSENGSDSTKIFTKSETLEGLWHGQNNYSLCWSPDGSKILFNSREDRLTSYMYVINSDGSDFTKVTSLTGVTDRSISWGK